MAAPACAGCYAAANDRKHKPHTPVCRNRIAKALAADETQAHRISDARKKEDAFLDHAVREADIERANGGQAQRDRFREYPIPVTPTAHKTATSTDQMPSNADEKYDEDRGTMTHDDMLTENDVHDVDNAEIRDDQMYDEIRSIRTDSEDMISSMIATVQRHVSEVWSPPRVTAMAPSYGLVPGSAYDIEADDEKGAPWNFDVLEQRNKCIREILSQRPSFLTGSPMCTAI